jgi:hypothetical protein
MERIKLSYAEFINYKISSNCSIDYIENDQTYDLFLSNSGFHITVTIKKLDPISSDQLDFETNYKNLAETNSQTNANIEVKLQVPFASKTLPNGNKLFKRYHGIQSVVSVGANDVIYTVPYPQVKIVGVDILYAEALDTVDFYVLDTITGTYSTIPNYTLNQFGFSVNVSKDFFRQESNYDADLYAGMQIKIVYNSQSAKTIGINFNMSEVKP